jgi:hypothetical protein
MTVFPTSRRPRQKPPDGKPTVLGDLNYLRLRRARGCRQVLAEPAAPMGVDNGDLIVANAIDVKLFETLLDIVY